ncbi:hypothetical protein SAMN05661091_4775 [Paenibacillus uliginis N3/975]|uniref:Uncharacterized protein n=1 Tax=Paenibacillus uliginis N3/975 TaxID=1313296 RepID=A0A1X7HNG7_9BACL|nr:hypothetical protein [Paenibacillus uliginis]SMF89785.1 hypothetical protein SAMN05661091_4775 [Paenibacillus uliginis N3/975]
MNGPPRHGTFREYVQSIQAYGCTTQIDHDKGHKRQGSRSIFLLLLYEMVQQDTSFATGAAHADISVTELTLS